MTDINDDPVSLWRRLFFRTVSSMEDPEPLAVDWPAGDVVMTVYTMPAIVAWCRGGQVTGLSQQTVVELRGHFSAPVVCFSWPHASAVDRITSIKVNGQEQLRQPDTSRGPSVALEEAFKTGIPGALFQPQPYTEEIRRRWWAWIPRLWERKDEDDDDD